MHKKHQYLLLNVMYAYASDNVYVLKNLKNSFLSKIRITLNTFYVFRESEMPRKVQKI